MASKYEVRLTWGEQCLVESFPRQLLWWYAQRYTPAWYRKNVPGEDLEQMAWVALVRSAMTYRGDLGCSFNNYGAQQIMRVLIRAVHKAAQRASVWVGDCETEDRKGRGKKVRITELVADHRRLGHDPLLKFWCQEDNHRLRRNLDWRTRLVLYLKLVECMTLEEVGECFGCSRERIRQIITKAERRMVEQSARMAVAVVAA